MIRGKEEMHEMYGREYTIRDIEALPAGQRAELIDGQMYMMASPERLHQQILGKLYRIIADYIDEKGGGCEVNLAPLAVYINDDDRNYVEPDIFVICDKDKLDAKGCHGAPDWIVDPEKEIIGVYDFERGLEKSYSFQEHVPAGIYEGFEIVLAV